MSSGSQTATTPGTFETAEPGSVKVARFRDTLFGTAGDTLVADGNGALNGVLEVEPL